MKKVTSFLLALVMVVSLLPGTAMTVAAEETERLVPEQNNYYSNVIVNEEFTNINSGITKGLNGTSTDEQYTTQGSSSALLRTGTLTTDGVCKGFASLDLATTEFDINRGFEVSFMATFNDLVVPKAGTAHASVSGFIVDVRAVSRCRYAFYADAEGNIWVTQYDNSEVAFDTGADLGDKYVEVRIVADDELNSSVIVDEQYVGRFTTTEAANASNNHFVLYTGTKNRVDDSHVNSVNLYDMKLAQAPVADERQAYYTFDEPCLDGAFNEANWSFEGTDKVALLSDENYLYVAVNNSDPDPDFIINGVSLTSNLSTGNVTMADGTWAGKVAKSATGNKMEIRIPLKSVLGLDYTPGQKVGFAYEWDGFDGAIVLASRALVDYKAFDGALSSGSTSSEVYAKETGGTLQLKAGTYSAGGTQTVFHKILSTQQMDMNAPFALEFTADFNDLVVPVVPTVDEGYFSGTWDDKILNETSPIYWYAAGVSIELRANPCHNYGFHADADGNIYVTQRMNDYTQVTRVDTGVDAGATNVNVRLATDENDVTTIYINGVALAETLSASTFECPKTGGRGYYQINNSTKYRDTTSSRLNDVALYNLLLTQDVPMPELREHPLAASDSADITAYLNPNSIELDGVLAEPEWHMAYSVSGVDGTPGGLLGVNWGDGNLYVAADTKAELIAVTLGGKRAVANLRPYQEPKSGKFAVGHSGFEWIIPLSRFGLTADVLEKDVAYEVSFANNLEEEYATVAGTLHFSGDQMLMGDTGRAYSGKDYYLGIANGHILRSRSDEGYVLNAEGLNILKSDGTIYATGTFVEKYSIPVDYSKGAFDLTLTATVNDLPNLEETADFGMRGLIFELCGDNMRAVFGLRKTADGDIWMDIRDTLVEQHCDTGVQVGTGEEITFRFAMDDKQSISLYVNDSFVHAFAPIDRRDLDASAVQMSVPHLMWGAYNSSRAVNADGSVSVVDAVIHEMKLTKSPYADDDAVVQAALNQITEELVLDGGDATDVTALNLPDSLLVDNIGETVKLSWTAVDKLTGRTAYSVNVKEGTVTRTTAAQAFDLKAVVSYGEANGSKTFTFQTKGTEVTEGTVALIENDDNPLAGAVTVWDSEKYVYLDNTHNSIVVNQGSSLAFNRITLRDTDNYSRISQRHLGVFISDDGQNWTKVTGWMLHQSGRNYTLYNLNATAQYVKVHCYHDDLDLVEGPTFYNKVSDMIKVSNETNLPGAAGQFAHTATFNATNGTDAEQKDTPVFISIADLGAQAGEYQTGCADFRFTIGDTTLAHWYNGEDGFYVRVPSIPANGSTTVTAHWGCGRVEDFSDGEAVFEVTYGNVSLINLSRETYEASGGDLEKSMLSHGRPFTFPNGDVIVVARTMKAASNAAVFRSTDGGRTFAFDKLAYQDGEHISTVAFGGATYRSSGFGGFLWDADRDENPNDDYVGRLYMITYSGQGGNNTDYRIVLNYTDDYGATWSDAVFLSLEGATDIIDKTTGESVVQTLQNSEARIGATDKAATDDPFEIQAGEMASRALLYCDGQTLDGADGAGPNVDYVIVHADGVYKYEFDANGNRVAAKDSSERIVTTAIYSKDGGATWICSDSLMCIPGVDTSRNSEDGLSESGFAQLDDGSLRVIVRAQQEGNYYLYEGVSTDFGATWTADYSDVLSVNTSPMLLEYGEDRLQVWSTCSGLGQTAYRRSPMHMGVSSDNYESFDKIIDLAFATAFDTVKAPEARKTQVGFAISPDGKTGFAAYHDQNWHTNDGAWAVDAGKFMEKGGTMGMLFEEFDEMLYGNKGAWDDFEDASLKYQGWIVDADGTIELSSEEAVSGKYSMKVIDDTSGSPAHALRQVPSMKSGTVGAKMMVPSTNEAPFVMELKAAYNYDHMKFAIAAVFVTPSGSVGYVDADGTQHVLTTVVAGTWNDYAVSFDISAGTGTLYVNGDNVGSFTLPSETPVYDLHGNVKDYAEMHGVTAVQFNQAGATQSRGDCVYVDDFYANELMEVSRTLEDDSAAQSVIGRFMTIVRKLIEVDGEQVEIVEWAWVPGL